MVEVSVRQPHAPTMGEVTQLITTISMVAVSVVPQLAPTMVVERRQTITISMVAVKAALQHAPTMVEAIQRITMIGMVAAQAVPRPAPTMMAERRRTTMTSTEAVSVLQRPVPTMAVELPRPTTMPTATASVPNTAGNRLEMDIGSLFHEDMFVSGMNLCSSVQGYRYDLHSLLCFCWLVLYVLHLYIKCAAKVQPFFVLLQDFQPCERLDFIRPFLAMP